jgi:hypothetical protein
MKSRLLASMICLCLSPLLVAEQVHGEASTPSTAYAPVATQAGSSLIETHEVMQTTTQVATTSSAVAAQAQQIETTDPNASNPNTSSPTPRPMRHPKVDHTLASIGRTIGYALLLPLELIVFLIFLPMMFFTDCC